MTNREFMQSLDTDHFAIALASVMQKPALWVLGGYVKQHSTPNDLDIIEWLEQPYDKDGTFWQYVNSFGQDYFDLIRRDRK